MPYLQAFPGLCTLFPLDTSKQTYIVTNHFARVIMQILQTLDNVYQLQHRLVS